MTIRKTAHGEVLSTATDEESVQHTAGQQPEWSPEDDQQLQRENQTPGSDED